MAVPALGTTRAQHAHTEKHVPKAQLVVPWGHPVIPVPVLAVAVPGLWGYSWGSPGYVDGMGKTGPPPEFCWLGGGDEDGDGMVLTWGECRPSGRAPASPQDSPLGGMLGSWLEKTPWPRQQAFVSNSKFLVRTAQGQGVGERDPTDFFGGTACMAALKSFC